MINDIILPDLATALEEFAEEVKCMEEANTIDDTKLNVKENSLVANAKDVLVDSDPLCQATKTSSIVLKRDKPLDQVRERSPSPERRISTSSSQSLPKSPVLIMKKPVLPIISKYRWQNGFRKSNGGQYIKVPLLKIEVHFSTEIELLPPSLHFSLYTDTNNNNDVSEIDESPLLAKCVKISRNRYLCEMAASEIGNQQVIKELERNFDGNFKVRVREYSVSSASASCIIPDFFLLVENVLARYTNCDSGINDTEKIAPTNLCWNNVDPILNVEHFPKKMFLS